MNCKLLLISLSAAALCSCSTAYKTGQTPDDVYYSPVRTYAEEAKVEEKREPRRSYRDYSEERQIRLGINNPRWRYFDNDISYNPYLYGYNYGYYYNPYYCSFPVYNPIIVTPVNPKVATPRAVNLAAYNSAYNNTNTYIQSKSTYQSQQVTTQQVPAPRTRVVNSRVGNTVNAIFNNSNNQSSSSQSNRSYTPSSSSSSSSSSTSSSSSSSSSTSRPARSGRN